MLKHRDIFLSYMIYLNISFAKYLYSLTTIYFYRYIFIRYYRNIVSLEIFYNIKNYIVNE